MWDLAHANELAYWFGTNPCRRVVAGGVERMP
jgi:imidazolonepropionase